MNNGDDFIWEAVEPPEYEEDIEDLDWWTVDEEPIDYDDGFVDPREDEWNGDLD